MKARKINAETNERERGLSILSVDDNILNLKLLSFALIKEGYNVLTATNGVQARRLASCEQPDLILLDIMMPGENGFEVIKKLKREPKTASIPVIILTSRNELDSKMLGFDLGAVDYVTKPFHLQEVIARIRLHLKLSLATNSMIASQAEKLRQIQDAQTALLISPDELPEASFDVHYLSLLEAGGDFYDVLRISDHIYGYFLADVSGHDLATSYMTSAVKALLKQNSIPLYQPDETVRLINDVLLEILPLGKYLTACYARLNRKTQKMTIINCGHPPAVYLPRDGESRLISVDGDVLGAFKDVVFGNEEINVKKGDRFFLYSDGLIEDPCRKKIWTQGLDNLLQACNLLREVPLEGASENLIELLGRHGIKAEDDIVLMVIEV
jgi:sigma-B regulation protein RsbU (phosphoserine phosphatase)